MTWALNDCGIRDRLLLSLVLLNRSSLLTSMRLGIIVETRHMIRNRADSDRVATSVPLQKIWP